MRAAAAAAAVLASQAAGPAWQAAGAAACGVTLGVSGRRRGRLSASGAGSALLAEHCSRHFVGAPSRACCCRHGSCMPALFATSSAFAALRLTRADTLCPPGALAAAAVGAATLAASLRCGATLLAFYAASSRLTSYREQAKAVDDDFKPGGQRDWVQVASPSFC